ncbi:MAG: hypothetical protein L3J79_03655, partial [Candidatus Marinimicrobia bacterium]|nr:hypothetical protein [Candidatus Neomarinimicrobiota bacterium]
MSFETLTLHVRRATLLSGSILENEVDDMASRGCNKNRRIRVRQIASLSVLALLAACGGGKDKAYEQAPEKMLTNPYPSTYEPYKSQPTLITGVTIFDGTGA